MTQLFDDLLLGGAPAIRALMGKHETLELDFKSRTLGRSGDKDDKRVLAKALSAFANSMGGLIVWGVDCRKDQQLGVDEVIGFTPISGLARFASDMRDWTVEAVMPRLANVRVEAIDEGNDTGFLLIDVERSERRPHRSEIGDKYYYRRSLGSSRAMEHFEIEDAFRRNSLPELVVEHQFQGGGYSNDGRQSSVQIEIDILLRNKSRISARNAYVSILQSFNIWESKATAQGIQVRRQPPLYFCELDTAVIHPGTARLLIPIRINIAMSKQGDHWEAQRSQLKKKIVVGYGCLDSQMRDATISISEADIHSYLQPAPVWIG